MKREKWLVLCFVLLLVQLVACERGKMKEDSPSPVSARTGTDSIATDSTEQSGINSAKIVAEKVTGIKRREPAVFTLVGSNSKYIKWRALPYAKTYDEGFKTTIFFEEPGKRRVFAIDSLTSDTTYIDVEVVDELYEVPQPGFGLSPDDELTVTPIAFPDSAENLLLLRCVTVKNYPCGSNQLMGIMEKQGNSYSLRFDKNLTTSDCKTGKVSKASGGMSDYFPDKFEGPIEISFNDKLFKGSFKRTGKYSWEFDWPYESGIVFTKKAL